MDELRYTFVPDSHGQYERVARMIDFHLDSGITDHIAFLGDTLNGPSSAKLISLIRSMGDLATTIVGNHEWVARNALSESTDSMVKIWRDEIWPGYEEDTLQSYGIHPTGKWERDARALREAMAERGDLAWLNGLKPYIATKRHIGVHAGPELDHPWANQAAALDLLIGYDARLHDEPAPIFSGELGKVKPVPKEVDERTFVTGHLHLTLPIDQRTANRKICLASPLNKGADLFVLQTGYEPAEDRIFAHAA